MKEETKKTLKYFFISIAIISLIILGPYLFGFAIFIIKLLTENC